MESRLVNTVAPVVVRPETDSKTELVRLMSYIENKNGSD
jgi:hypothetical protein